MDIRRLLKATCPLARGYCLANSAIHRSSSTYPGAASQGYSRSRRATGSTQALHTSHAYPYQGFTLNTLHSHWDHQQTRHRSTLSSAGYRTRRCSVDRLQASTLHTRPSFPNHHRTLRPSLTNWRNRHNLKSAPAGESRVFATETNVNFRTKSTARLSSRPRPSSSSPSSSLSSLNTSSTSASASASSSSAPAPASASSSISTPNPAFFKPIPSYLKSSNPTLSTLFKLAKAADPSQISRMGRKRRHMAAMHRFRLQRHLKLMQRSAPQHSSMFLSLDGHTKTRLKPSIQSQRKLRRSKLRKWASTSPVAMKIHTPSQRYMHVHYYYRARPYPQRIRFLGFQHFLRHSKMFSSRGQRAFWRAKTAQLQRTMIKERNAMFSWRRPLVRHYRRRLEELDEFLEQDKAQHAIRRAKYLMLAKPSGARLPDGTQLLRLVKMDEAHYVESQRASSNIAPRLQRFSTQDYNTILERCEDLEDWVNGFKIAQILFSRYRAPKFDFQSKDGAAPNTRTIALLASIFVRSGRPSMAGYWFKSLHGRFPHPIPLDVYTAFLGQLLTTPGEIRLMQSVLDHLHKHGPKPTTTVYNNLLRAIGTQEGISRAEAFVKHMLSLGYAADRQSFRILIDTSLKELDMPRAHYWLAEYGRQGFEVIPRMLEPFMRTCIRQIIRDQGGFSTQFAAVDADSYSQEWMYKALHVIRYMSSQGIAPTATTFELLIEGLLSQGDLLQAKNVLRIMRGSPHLYTPASRTWILFFEHHLAVDDHSSAWRVLNEMRRAIETQPISYGSVPRRLYHQLFRHLLERDKLSLAERTLYELMIRENRYQPRESEVVDLIWKLDHHPEAAERVYELLYSHTEKTPAGRPKTVHSNRIMVQGPVQMAHVGVMRAKASSRNDALRDDVMRSWNAMTQYFTERQLSSGHSTTSLEEQQVMALAFEQVAKAARKSKFMERGHVSALQDRGQGANDNQTADGWDFGQIRRSLSGGLGLGLRAGYGMGDASMVAASPAVAASNGGSEAVPSALASRHLEFKGPNRMLIQQLLKRQEFLQPLLERRDKSASSTGSSAMDTTGGRDVTRFETLKSSFEWVQEHHIPIGIDGLNSYLESLLSYQNVDAAKDVVERFLLSSVPSANADAETSTTSPNTTEVASSEEGKSPVSSSSSSPLCPDVNTVRILSEHKGLIIGGLELVDRVLCKGGTELSKAWAEYMESSRGRVSPRIRS